MSSIAFLNDLRQAELALMLDAFPPAGRVLEIGAGTGRQAMALAEKGYEVVAIDVDDGMYTKARVFDVISYDGGRLPFADAEFDVIFSSNVLEHIANLDGIHREMHRVLKQGGICIHAMPTPSWRAWTLVTALAAGIGRGAAGFTPRTPLKGLLRVLWRVAQPFRLLPHGERGNALSELATFRAAWWRLVFERNGFEIVAERPVGLFYTGAQLLGSNLSVGSRRRFARLAGSACRLYVTRPKID